MRNRIPAIIALLSIILLIAFEAILPREVVHAQARSPGIPINCTVTISTSTSLATVGGQCLARPLPDAIYITDILFSTNASAIAADTFNTLKYGTGTNCGTGTTVIWGAMSASAVQATTGQSFVTPLRVPPGNDLCWINSTAGSKFLVITGYEAP